MPSAFIVPEKETSALIAKYPEEEVELKDIVDEHVTDHKVPYKALPVMSNSSLEFLRPALASSAMFLVKCEDASRRED